MREDLEAKRRGLSLLQGFGGAAPIANVVLVFLILAANACDRAPAPSGEWSPNDHDKETPAQQGQQAPPTGSTRPSARELVIEAAWGEHCAMCHGPMGHGDGPQGQLVKAPDLTLVEWQAKVTDQEIAAQIRHGKGLMPPSDLPDTTIQGLVARIRVLKGH